MVKSPIALKRMSPNLNKNLRKNTTMKSNQKMKSRKRQKTKMMRLIMSKARKRLMSQRNQKNQKNQKSQMKTIRQIQMIFTPQSWRNQVRKITLMVSFTPTTWIPSSAASVKDLQSKQRRRKRIKQSISSSSNAAIRNAEERLTSKTLRTSPSRWSSQRNLTLFMKGSKQLSLS